METEEEKGANKYGSCFALESNTTISKISFCFCFLIQWTHATTSMQSTSTFTHLSRIFRFSGLFESLRDCAALKI